jgi:hypothetical protein
MILEPDNSQTYSVCSIARLSGFGETTVTYSTNLPSVNNPQVPLDKFKEHIRDLMKKWDADVKENRSGYTWYQSETGYVPKLAAVIAWTASGQQVTMSHFRSLGFKEIGPFEKLKHPDSTLTFWIIPADDLCKAVGYISKYDPRTVEERGY